MKRTFDVVAASLALVFLAPLAVLIALGLALEGEGGVFYVQWRVGRHGRPFRMWKLRSLRARGDLATPLGRWLRRTALNELPQLWNVIRGEMSLVGPRPETLELAARWRRELALWDRRHRVRPGLAGLAQVRLGAGAPEAEKLRLDLLYLDRGGAGKDLAILLAAVGLALGGRCDGALEGPRGAPPLDLPIPHA
ncbi:MAG: sugar transferase [Planctomycetes bacterium]|nr:sugar transferase [Planctomycetota bacterium]